jgi:hypothetical protein
MAGAGVKALVVVVVLVLVVLVIDFNFIGSSLTQQFRFNYLPPPATEIADETTPTNKTTPPPGTPPSFFVLSLFRSLFLSFFAQTRELLPPRAEEDPSTAPAPESSLPSPVAPSPAQSTQPRPAEPASGADAETAAERRGPRTEVDCREHGSYCIYTNLCYDGETVRTRQRAKAKSMLFIYYDYGIFVLFKALNGNQ